MTVDERGCTVHQPGRIDERVLTYIKQNNNNIIHDDHEIHSHRCRNLGVNPSVGSLCLCQTNALSSVAIIINMCPT